MATNTTIKIKRSTSSGAPGSLVEGELAYSGLSGNLSNGGDRLYIGIGNVITTIGGKYFTSMLDHTPGTTTASSALIVDENKKLNELLVGNITVTSNSIAAGSGDLTLSTTAGAIKLSPTSGSITFYNAYSFPTTAGTNGYILKTDGAGNLVWSDPTSVSVAGSNGQVQYNNDGSLGASSAFTFDDGSNTLTVNGNISATNVIASSLTSSRVVYVGANDELVDSANMTFSGTLLSVNGNVSATNLISNNLTATRVVYVGANDELVDSANLTFDGSNLTVGSGAGGSITGANLVSANYFVGSLTGNVVGTDLTASSLTQNRVVFVGSGGKLVDDADLTFDGSNLVIGAGGNVTAPTFKGNVLATDVTASSLTQGRVVFAGASGKLVDDGDLTFDGSNLSVTGTVTAGSFSGNFVAPGSTTQVMFNDGGTIAGDSGMTYNKSTDALTVVGTISGGNLVDTSLTATRVVFVGTGGELDDSTNLTYSGGNLTVGASGTIIATYLQGTLTTAAQPNVTSLGTLTGLTVNGTSNLGPVTTVKISGGTSGQFVKTDGNGNLSFSAVDLATSSVTGILPVAQGGTGTATGSITGTGNLTFTATGEGSTVVLAPGANGVISASSTRITNLAEPVNSTDAATKYYVDNAVTGLDWKTAVNVLANANIALSGSGNLVIDNYTIESTDVGYRVLLTGQTTTGQNGIYDVVYSGSNYTLTRSADSNTAEELKGASVFVLEGTLYGGSAWVQQNHYVADGGGGLITGQNWIQFAGGGAYTAGDGLSLNGTEFNVNIGNGIVFGTSNNLEVQIAGSSPGLSSTPSGLTLNLKTGGGLAQDGNGVYVATDGITNDMLLNEYMWFAGDSGSNVSTSLGSQFAIKGTGAISTTMGTGNVMIAVATATDSGTLGVASFDPNNFTVTSGLVTLDVVGVNKGGTGQTTFTTGQVLYGNGTSPISTSASFIFDGTGRLDVGNLSVDSANAKIALNTAGNLTIEPTNGSLVIDLSSGNVSKVSLTGVTASDYSQNLGNLDLTTKFWVEDYVSVIDGGTY